MSENVAKTDSAAASMSFALSDLKAFNLKFDKHNVVLALDSSALDLDQVENLIKFCPTKEEMTMLKLIAEKILELLDFDKDLIHLVAASKIQLNSLAEEMQAVSKGLEKVEQELNASENDGAISAGLQKVGDILGTRPVNGSDSDRTRFFFFFFKFMLDLHRCT
ncbi:hypothetical protein ACSBR1_026953 [Camellia fascicularis]